MRSRPIICIETGKEYSSINEARKEFPSVRSSAIYSHRKCNGKHWCYVSEDIESIKENIRYQDAERKLNHYKNNSIKILNWNKSRIYNSITEAEKDLRISRYRIKDAITNQKIINGIKLELMAEKVGTESSTAAVENVLVTGPCTSSTQVGQ